MQKFEPLFDFFSDNSNILIHKSNADVCVNKTSYSGDGEVRLKLLPKASIYLYGYFHDVPVKDALESFMGQANISSFSINGQEIEDFKLSSGGDANSQEYNLKWCPKSKPINGIGNETTQISYLVFHLVNFVDFSGARKSIDQNGSSSHAIEHMDLVCDERNVEIKSIPSTRESFKTRKEKGGYRLTHIGQIKKNDKTLFIGKDANDCLNVLRFFLSFAKGGWC